ncbi:hypothetical protein TSTA_007860 [Talaromyces stipitatus ATCC 10500]|uniref:CCHC-type domain-containing protein n=1 Tax=Talaromyces stipitatus (strain ATCC 10500 / CBS 375.48 / QM 6759 / NRRL 1006) TaxID=441959 RepID=B8MVD6_TALSN|nr:uncharacterized protein TSTA_007860 [Talaromyces stipitatus ATCC 10500]EED11496.1 hypothetical protein TSTA_007860 [Talaromyces stipitatus ATCC 10500]
MQNGSNNKTIGANELANCVLDIKCFNCNEMGHIARNCLKPDKQKKSKEQSRDDSRASLKARSSGKKAHNRQKQKHKHKGRASKAVETSDLDSKSISDASTGESVNCAWISVRFVDMIEENDCQEVEMVKRISKRLETDQDETSARKDKPWVIDGGATRSCSGNIECFLDLDTSYRGWLGTAGKSTRIMGKERVKALLENGDYAVLNNVLKDRKTLAIGYNIGRTSYLGWTESRDALVTKSGPRAEEIALLTREEPDWDIIHRHFGHPGKPQFKRLAKKLGLELSKDYKFDDATRFLWLYIMEDRRTETVIGILDMWMVREEFFTPGQKKWKSAYEMLYKKKFDIAKLRVPFCKVWFHTETKDKLDPRAHEGVFVGYTKSSSQYLVLDRQGRVRKVTNPIFLEDERGFISYETGEREFTHDEVYNRLRERCCMFDNISAIHSGSSMLNPTVNATVNSTMSLITNHKSTTNVNPSVLNQIDNVEAPTTVDESHSQDSTMSITLDLANPNPSTTPSLLEASQQDTLPKRRSERIRQPTQALIESQQIEQIYGWKSRQERRQEEREASKVSTGSSQVSHEETRLRETANLAVTIEFLLGENDEFALQVDKWLEGEKIPIFKTYKEAVKHPIYGSR